MRALLVAIAFSALACAHAVPEPSERAARPEIQLFSEDDAEMNAAIGAARASFDRYLAAASSPSFAGAYRSIKVPVSDGARVEHIWLDSPVVKEGRVSGALGNEPVGLRGVSLGQRVDTAVDQISDWMLVRDGELFGGFTLNVQFSHLAEKERRAFLESVDFRVPPQPRIP